MAKTATVRSTAKINLCLDILGRDPSGYHEIQTAYHELPDLFDELEIEATDSPEIIVQCDHPDVPVDKTNTAKKAALLLQKFAGVNTGAKIFIRKKIPVFSGLGGGSSNASAVLNALNKLWNTDLSHETLADLAAQIGMDCAFFLTGGTALGTHFGEHITHLPPLPNSLQIHEIDTGIKVSSKEAYGWTDENSTLCGKNIAQTKNLIAALRSGDAKKILENLHNDFEPFIFKKFPELRKYKTPHTFLCGSGGALFRISLK